VAKADKKGRSLSLCQVFPLPEGLVVEGEVADSEKLAQFLEGVKRRIGVDEEMVVVGVPEMKASVHSLVLPPIDLSEIDQAVKLQSDSFLPFPYHDEYLDWMLVKELKDGRKRVLISAVPRKVINGFVDSLEKAGLNPIAFETTSLSLLRLLPDEGKSLSFIAEIGEVSTVLILGGRNDVKAVSVVGRTNHFLETVGKMTEFYVGHKDGDGVERIYLCGKNLTKEFLREIKNKLGIEPSLIRTDLKGVPQGKESELAVLTSLALKEVAPPEDEATINILPKSLVKKYQDIASERKIGWFGLIMILLVVGFGILSSFFYFQVKKEKAELRSKITSASLSLEDPASLADWITKAALVNQFSPKTHLAGKIMDQFLGSSFKNVEISGFNFNSEKNEVVFTGRAKTRDDLLNLKEEMEKKDFVVKAALPLSSLEKEENPEFRMRLEVK